MNDVVYIYALCDPRTNEVRYVGKTNNINKRLSAHIKEKSNTLKCNWIKSLTKIGMLPLIQIIDISNNENWQIKEQYWIGMFPNLLNMAEGGVIGCKTEYKSRGSKQHLSKLTDEIVFKIINFYKYTTLSSGDLAKMYCVTPETILSILRGKTWKHINNGVNTESLFPKSNSANKNKKLHGELVFTSKLKIHQVNTIMELYQYTNLSQQDLSKIFGVEQTCIWSILNGKTWKCVNNGNKTVSLFNKMSSNKNGNNQGEKTSQSKLKEYQVVEIKRRLFNGEKHKEISKDYDIDVSMISRINLNKSWKHVTI